MEYELSFRYESVSQSQNDLCGLLEVTFYAEVELQSNGSFEVGSTNEYVIKNLDTNTLVNFNLLPLNEQKEIQVDADKLLEKETYSIVHDMDDYYSTKEYYNEEN